MVGKMMALPPVRFVADALIGFGVFAGLTVGLLGPSAAAGLVAGSDLVAGVPGVVLASQTIAAAGTGLNDSRAILIVLAVVFSALFALNVAFIRHLRQVHSAVRSGHGSSQSPEQDQNVTRR